MSRGCRSEGCRGRAERGPTRTGTQALLERHVPRPSGGRWALCFFSMDLRGLGAETTGCLKPQRDKASKPLFFSCLPVSLRGDTSAVRSKTVLYWADPSVQGKRLTSLVSRHDLFAVSPGPAFNMETTKNNPYNPKSPWGGTSVVKRLLLHPLPPGGPCPFLCFLQC